MVYLFGLFYLFLGVNIASDKFMSGIEVITSRKLRVRKRATGRTVTVRLWNDTMANLTLLALGSSAPEILLSLVEVLRNECHSGELGPSTIVGSAAFNLFVIVAVCIMAIESPDVRRIKNNGVFIVTAICSLGAYFWLVLIVQVISPNIVDVWEGFATLALFPALLVVSYSVDVGLHRRLLGLPGRTDSGSPKNTAKTRSGEGNTRDTDFRRGEIVDEDGKTINNPAGVLTFESDETSVLAGSQERRISIPVLRKNGLRGAVSCRYRLEQLTAIPGYDYKDVAGDLLFGNGECRADIEVVLLPKRPGEHHDSFQVVLEDVQGGALFNPFDDGGEDQCLLTVTILNENDHVTQSRASLRALQMVDRVVNIDSIRYSSNSWYEDIVAAIFDPGAEEDEESTTLDWVLHTVSVPWKLLTSLIVPPAAFCGGWPCFTLSLMVIGGLTALIIDFAELFGCCAGVNDSVTAITLVALGTSLPDLFASKTAASQDECADASIVNVTGSNSVNVFLGVGLPWTAAALYWTAVGATDDWKQRYPDFVSEHPGGAFVVNGGPDLTFSVIVFTIGATIALATIRLRRIRLGGELGGPFKMKVLSAGLLISLWFFYVSLSIWKVRTVDASIGDQAFAIVVGLFILENAMILIGCGAAATSPKRKEEGYKLTAFDCSGDNTDSPSASSGKAANSTAEGSPIDAAKICITHEAPSDAVPKPTAVGKGPARAVESTRRVVPELPGSTSPNGEHLAWAEPDGTDGRPSRSISAPPASFAETLAGTSQRATASSPTTVRRPPGPPLHLAGGPLSLPPPPPLEEASGPGGNAFRSGLGGPATILNAAARPQLPSAPAEAYGEEDPPWLE